MNRPGPKSGYRQSAEHVEKRIQPLRKSVRLPCAICGKEVKRPPCRMGKLKFGLVTCSHKCRGVMMSFNHRGVRSSRWTGGVRISAQGYRKLHPSLVDPRAVGLVACDSQGYVMEHRMVMALKLGRKLTRNEYVHHVNGDKLDNRPGNLALMGASPHIRQHRNVITEVQRLRRENERLRLRIAELEKEMQCER